MYERKEIFFVMAWSIGIALIWLGPALFGYAMHITDHDTALYYYPLFDFYAKALQSGQSFLWIPGMFSGFPVYVSQVGGFFDPINLVIFSFFSGINGVHVRLFFDFVAVCIFSYLASRSLGLSRAVSMLVGPSYLIAFHLRFLSNPVTANTLFLIPLLVYAANGLIDATLKRLYVFILISLGVGVALLAGYTQIVVYALLAVGIYALIRVTVERTESFRSLLLKGVVAAVGVGAGVVIALPFILPATAFLPLTSRGESLSYEQATLKVIEYGDLVLFAIPDNFYIPYVTAGRKPLYIGSVLCFAAVAMFAYLASVIYRRRVRIESQTKSVAVGAVFLSFLVLSLQYSPAYYLFSKLPLVGQFRFPFRFMFVGIFFFALLGAFGIDRWGDITKEKFVRGVLWGASILMTLLVATLIAINILTESSSRALAQSIHSIAVRLNVYELVGLSKGTDHYAEALVRALGAMREILSFSEITIVFPTGVLAAAIALVIAYFKSYVSEQWFRKIAISITCVTVLVTPVLRYRNFVPVSEAGTAPHAAVAFASTEDATLYRMYSFLPAAAAAEAIPPQYKLSYDEEEAIKELAVRSGTPNYHLYQNLGSVDGYDQFETRDTIAAMGLVGGELGAGYGSGTYEERAERLLSNLDILAMMGGKYIISGVELTHPNLRLLEKDLATAYKIPVYVYTLDARPRYYVPEKVIARPHRGFVELIQNGVPSFKKETYLDCVDCPQGGSGTILLRKEENGLYELDVTLKKDGYIVLSESLLPGWRAWIDEQSIDIIRANGLYMAVRVPEGSHVVRFKYQGLRNELDIIESIMSFTNRN